MAGPACKVIINNGLQAIAQSLEQVLTSPLVRDNMILAAEADRLLQRLVDIDLQAYWGAGAPDGYKQGLVGVMADLVTAGVFTEEIWAVFARPGSGTAKKDADEPGPGTPHASAL